MWRGLRARVVVRSVGEEMAVAIEKSRFGELLGRSDMPWLRFGLDWSEGITPDCNSKMPQ